MHKVGDLIGKLVPTGPRTKASVPDDAQPRTETRSAPKAHAAPVPRPPARSAAPAPEAASRNAPLESVTTDAKSPPPRPLHRPRRNGPASELTLVKSVLSKVLAKKGLEDKVERYGFVLHWRDIVGEQLAEVSRPDCISRRALVVRVTHSTWAQELSFLKPVLLAKLAHYLKPGDIVEDVVFRVGLYD